MIDANAKLFQRLVEFCVSREAPLEEPEVGRYLEGDTESDLIIQHLKLARQVQFGSQRAAIHATFQDDELIILVGFENVDEYLNRYSDFGEDVEEIDFLPGHCVVILSEVDVRPRRSGREVRAYVEVADLTTPLYEGHDFGVLKGLFPRMSVFKFRSTPGESSFSQLVTKFAAAESAYGVGWIGEELLGNILTLASISARSFPYDEISRAVFDTDPRSLYLALYRCLEATYAYKTSEDLATALGLDISWSELAVKLGQNLKWRPREASSLEIVLRYASNGDLRKLIASLGGSGEVDPAGSAASLVYDLRNRIVHFGPSLDSVGISSYDWNAVCCAMVGVTFDVFDQAFDSPSV